MDNKETIKQLLDRIEVEDTTYFIKSRTKIKYTSKNTENTDKEKKNEDQK